LLAEPPRLSLYSAHDTTVFSLLSALGVTDTAPLPDFTANVAFELWQLPSSSTEDADDGGRFSVVIKYNGEQLQGLRWCAGAQGREGCTECENGECDLRALQEGLQGRTMDAKECETTSVSAAEKDAKQEGLCCHGKT
jgi:hypothetical protein